MLYQSYNKIQEPTNWNYVVINAFLLYDKENPNPDNHIYDQ